jgi:PPOX class probable F420-dependent enzyme
MNVNDDPGTARYVSLATFRRSGAVVATPVWIARAGSFFYVFSAGNAGKVKRIRHNDAVRLAACDMRGTVHGAWREGHARLVTDPAVLETAYRALRQKYGWLMTIADVFAKLNGRYARRAMLEIEIDNNADSKAPTR